jgi:hypothetical protein
MHRGLPLVCVLLFGCEGTIGGIPQGDPGADPIDGSLSFATERASATVRRLSIRELGNALESLTGLRPDALSALPADKLDYIYDRIVEAQTVSSLHEDAFAKLADEVTDRLLAGAIGGLVPACPGAPPAGDGPAAGVAHRPCARGFVDGIAPRAFRRPLRPSERDRLLGLYDAAESYGDGMRQVIHAVFRSPNFLYLVEVGRAVPGAPGVYALTDHEIAARLSFSLCEMPPDDALRRAADHGELQDRDAIAAHAARLMDHPCARETVRSFWSHWLRLSEVAVLEKDAAAFPGFDEGTAAAMERESTRFLDDVTWARAGTLRDVFDAPYSIVDAEVAALYGLKGVGAEPERVALPPERRGILTHPSLLALTSDRGETAPVKRGVFVLRRVLCGDLPNPPQNLEIVKPKPDPNATTRERWAEHSKEAACAPCHTQIDPVGFAMEDFDAIGRHRTKENGRPVDARGGVPLLGIEDGAVSGGAELAAAVADSSALRACFTRQWLRFAAGRMEAETDRSAAETVLAAVRSRSLKDALLTVAATDVFRLRRRGGAR